MKEGKIRTVFITGGAAGIGAAAVRKFASEEWNVVFMDLDQPRGLAPKR